MNWLITHLFGSHALAHFTAEAKVQIAAYIAANPGATKDAVVAYITPKADALINKVLIYFPGWAAAILSGILMAEMPSVISSAYDQLVRSISSK